MYEVEAIGNMPLITARGKLSIAQVKAEIEPEAMLVTAVVEGNRDQFAQLYDLYAPLVHGILLARVPRNEVADLVQDIFLHALKKLHTLRDRTAFGPWIAMIARNRAMDFHRQSRETVGVTEDLGSTKLLRRQSDRDVGDYPVAS
ncbi:MAG: RNA polymerase sigma factor [Pyrinomonadaceae bacterium]